MTRKETIARIRTLINDREGRCFHEDTLLDFIELAEEKIPFIAAALIVMSVGNNESARLLMAMAGMFSSEEEKPVLVSSTKGPV